MYPTYNSNPSLTLDMSSALFLFITFNNYVGYILPIFAFVSVQFLSPSTINKHHGVEGVVLFCSSLYIAPIPEAVPGIE